MVIYILCATTVNSVLLKHRNYLNKLKIEHQ